MENQIFWTVFSGSLVATIGLIAKSGLNYYLFDRANEFALLRGNIETALITHADVYSSGGNNKEEYWKAMNQELRQLAGRAEAFVWKRHWLLLKLPPKNSILQIKEELIFLSNAASSPQAALKTYDSKKKIRSLLNGEG